MNSLAHASDREKAFVGIVEPLPDSVFHSKSELLWNVKHFLDNNQHDANAPGALYDYLRSQIEIRRIGYEEKSKTHSSYLYPSSDTPVEDRELIFRSAWFNLAEAILVAAERLWRDVFLTDATDKAVKSRFHAAWGHKDEQENVDAEVGSFSTICQQSHTLMHLWLQAMLFYVRAMQNVRSGDMILRPRKRKHKIEGRLEEVTRRYLKTLADWEDDIQKITGLRFFGLQYGDVQWFRALSKEFGPTSVHVEETGWITLAADARTELRYQFFKARMRENRKTHHYLTAAIQWLFGITTGFGTRPRRFLATAFILISTYFFLFLANDWLQMNPRTGGHFCAASGSAALDWWHLLIKYLYLAVTNMSSLGSDNSVAQFCGTTFSQALLTSSAIVGYFLLAMLAALLFQIITERD